MMKVVCAWCKREMGEKMGPDVVTHGICAACLPKVLAGVDSQTYVCPDHGRYWPVPSIFDGSLVCPVCDRLLVSPDGPVADSCDGYKMSPDEVDGEDDSEEEAEDDTCMLCKGCGEGQYEGTVCPECHGSGTVKLT